MASAILFESRTTILATVQHNWQCISWLYIGSRKEFHVKGYANVSKHDGRIWAQSYTRHPYCLRVKWGEGQFKCLLRSHDWVIAQIVRLNRLENRTGCNSLSSDFHPSGTFEWHATLYDWPMYRAIARLRSSESYRVAASLACDEFLSTTGVMPQTAIR